MKLHLKRLTVSRLLNSIKAWISPSAPGAVSLGFRGNVVVLARAIRQKDGYYITHLAEESLPFTPFINTAPSDDDCTVFTQTISNLSALIPQSFWPLQVALPDPAAIVQVMQFDALPAAVHEREAIAKFRLEKEFPALTQMQCRTQDISRVDKPGLLLATFIHSAWLACLKDACRNAGLFPGVIDMTVSYLFNRFYKVILTTIADGVLIFVEKNTWTILIWDGDHRPRFVRSRWLDTNNEKDAEYDLIVKDVERLILSYVLREHRRKVDSIFLCAKLEDRVSLAELLDMRMKVPCVQLDVTDKISLAPDLSISNIPPGLLAAFFPR